MNKRICKICGKEFDFWHSKAKTCGKECSKKYGEELKKLYTKNNKEKIRKAQREHYYKNRKLKKKKCKICGKHFYLRGANAKTCSDECRKENIRRNGNKNSKIWVKRHPKKRKKICHEYSIKNREVLGIKAKKWRKKNPQKAIGITKRWRKNNPKKRNAQAKAQYNIKIPIGKLCEICKEKKAVQRHHQDYEKPLEVMFVCSMCHINLHLNKK